MTVQQYLAQVRQYSQLSQRKHKSYAPVVDRLTEDLKSSAELPDSRIGMTAQEIEAMRDREYNPLYRSFPPTRPTD